MQKSRTIRLAQESPEAILILIAACLAFGLKWWLNLTTFGTNDMAYWTNFANYLQQNGWVSIYRDIRIYNHPPLISVALIVFQQISQHTGIPFPVLLRTPAILADLGSTFVLWKLAVQFMERRAALRVVGLFAISPLLIMISGFHGNTDPVFMFFVYLAAYFLLVKESWMASALSLGFAMNIKIVPIIAAPAFFFWLPSGRLRLKFTLVTAGVALAGFAYHIVVIFPELYRNVFQYGGIPGIWGATKFIKWHMPILRKFYSQFGRLFMLAGILYQAWWLGRESLRVTTPQQNRSKSLLEALAMTFLLFLVMTPGFGVQYLAWLVAPAVFLGGLGQLGFTLLGSVFLFKVYTFWNGGGLPWKFANSDLYGQWQGNVATLDSLLWYFLVVWYGALLFKKLSIVWERRTHATRSARTPNVRAPLHAFDSRGKKIAIFVIAYNASSKIRETLARIPADVARQVAEIFVVDDCSPDDTHLVALQSRELPGMERLTILRNARNQGYGGNQKIGYEYAISKGCDVVLMLHADGQYAPEVMGSLLEPLVEGRAEVVMGSRMARGCDPLAGGMPLYKYIGNRVLTWLQNKITGMHLAEFHSGYRAYSCHALKKLPLFLNSNTWHFDTEIILEAKAFNLRILEVPIPTYYGDEICHVNGVGYAINCLFSVLRYRLCLLGLYQDIRFDEPSWKRYPYEAKDGDPFSSHELALQFAEGRQPGGGLLEIGPGSGVMTAQFSRLGFDVTVVEAEPRFAKLAGEKANRVIAQDAESLDWDALPAFDVIVLSDVLEHLRDPGKVMLHCVDHLAPGGRIFVSIPNAAHWSVRFGSLAGRFRYRDRGILDKTHLRFFTRKSIEALLREAGLRIVERNVTPVPLPLVVPACRVGRRLAFLHLANQLMTQSWRNFFGYQWVFSCEHAPGVKPMQLSASGTVYHLVSSPLDGTC